MFFHVFQHLREGVCRPGVKLAAVHLGQFYREILGKGVFFVHQAQVPGPLFC